MPKIRSASASTAFRGGCSWAPSTTTAKRFSTLYAAAGAAARAGCAISPVQTVVRHAEAGGGYSPCSGGGNGLGGVAPPGNGKRPGCPKTPRTTSIIVPNLAGGHREGGRF